MLYVIIAGSFYALAILFASLASKGTNTTVVSAIQNAASILLPLVLLTKGLPKLTVGNRAGMLYALASGICIGAFALSINRAYAQVNVSIVAPLALGITILLSCILSVVLFRERLSLLQLVGLVTMFSGLGLIIIAKLRA